MIREADNLRHESLPTSTQNQAVSCEVFMAGSAAVAQTEEHKLGAYMMATGAAKVTAYRALTWQQRNKNIEADRHRDVS